MSETTMTDQATTDAEAAPSAPDQALDHEQDTGGDSAEGDAQKQPGRFRERLAAAESERDRLTEVLLAQRDAIFESEVTAAGMKPELLRAAGMGVGDYVTAAGLIDIAALAEAIETKRLELGLPDPTRRPKPNPLAGVHGDRSLGKADLGAILQEHARSAHRR